MCGLLPTTSKDAYPLPLPDEVQDHLAGSTVFSTLDFQSGYWQMRSLCIGLQLQKSLQHSVDHPTSSKWKKPSLHRYRQLWSQLKLVDRVVYRTYAPGPLSDSIDVPIVPSSLQHEFLHHHHNSPAAGHQGPAKTLQRLRHEGYWVNMVKDMDTHCRECVKCRCYFQAELLWLICLLADDCN